MATTKPQVWTCKKSKTCKKSLKMSNLDMGHSSKNLLHAVLCLHCPDTFSYLMENLLSRRKKKWLKANTAQVETSPGSGLITCLSPTPLHVHLTFSHITDCTAAKDYGSKNKCTQLVSPLSHKQTVPLFAPAALEISSASLTLLPLFCSSSKHRSL